MPRRLGRENIACGPIKRPKLGQFDIQTLFPPDRQTGTVTAKKERKAAWAGVTVPLQPALLDEPWDNQNHENPPTTSQAISLSSPKLKAQRGGSPASPATYLPLRSPPQSWTPAESPTPDRVSHPQLGSVRPGDPCA